MAALDPRIDVVRQKYGLEASDFWELPQKKGTWIAKHAALEMAAAKAGIVFEMPVILEADGPGKCAAICVQGTMDSRKVWSIGEASPANSKNSYPYAMAEKRAVDRVILKLIGLHGLAYSEDEADDFKQNGSAVHPTSAPEHGEDQDIHDGVRNWLTGEKTKVAKCGTLPALYSWLENIAGSGGTITDPDSGSILARCKSKSPGIYGEVVKTFQMRLRFINDKQKETV